MRKLKEILRLYYSCHQSQRRISVSCSVSRPTIKKYIAKMKKAGFTWPLPDNITEEQLEASLYPPEHPNTFSAAPPNWGELSKELKKKNVTRMLLWEEYIEQNPNGLGYSRFCSCFRDWLRCQDPVMRQIHKGGEKLFIDYAGPTVPVYINGEIKNAQIFVATFGASNYTYVEATFSQNLFDWLSSHVRAFKFFGGVPKILVPDNLKSGVTKACYYEPDINKSYHDLSVHYDTTVIPARSRHPKDKAKVENAVLVTERWILAKLRHFKFFSLAELNRKISELLIQLNNKPFQKMDGCRKSLYEEVDKPLLQPLPIQHYQFSEFKLAKVNIDYHVEYKKHYYSVPYQFVRQSVELRITENTLEVFSKNNRIASHLRSDRKGFHTTTKEHMPKKHQHYSEWSPERILSWGGKIGPCTRELLDMILKSRKHHQQGYRSCLGVLRLEKNYGSNRLESASARALKYKAISYKSIHSILKCGLDRVHTKTTSKFSISHDNIRGQSILQN